MERQSPPTTKTDPINTPVDVHPNKECPVDEVEELNDDGREIGRWESRWPSQAKAIIRREAAYVSFVFVATLVALVFTWRGDLYSLLAAGCSTCSENKITLFAYLFLGGTLGGTLFGIKFLYKVVARGYWNADRWLWRMFSPLLSGGLAMAVGALLDSGLLGVTAKLNSGSYYFSIGFVTGYFADRALGKMQEIATTIFGNPGQS